jgi:hypothetical protein
MSRPLAAFAETHGITMKSGRIPSRPGLDDDEWNKSAFHFRIVLSCSDRTMETYYSMGSGHAVKIAWEDATMRERYAVRQKFGYPVPGKHRFVLRPPTPDIADVLESLQSDSRDSDSSFDSWASDFGYDTDSRKAESVYRACQESARKLRNLMGLDLYRDFLAIDPDE